MFGLNMGRQLLQQHHTSLGLLIAHHVILQKKINSSYKAKEFQTYVYGLAPALLHGLLPDVYWRNFCKLVRVIRLLHQQRITLDQIQLAHEQVMEFVVEFEALYYQWRASRLHFCQPSLHTLVHASQEICRVGPLPYYAQWTLERLIGDLGKEIRQPSNPFANLAQRGLIRFQVNALKAMDPSLDHSKSNIPNTALDAGDSYFLLHKREHTAHAVTQVETDAIHAFLEAVQPGEGDSCLANGG